MLRFIKLAIAAVCGLWLVNGVVAGAAHAQTAAPSATPGAAEPGPAAKAQPPALTGEQAYAKLRGAARGDATQRRLLGALRGAALAIDWKQAQARSMLGHVRVLEPPNKGDAPELFLVRDVDGNIFVMALPAEESALEKGSGSPYANLRDQAKNKLQFETQVASATVDGTRYDFVRLTAAPQRLLLDRLFFIAIVALLFLVMVGMGLTLTTREFALVFRKPKGMVIGVVLQFGLLPLVAMALGRLAGFYDAYPFIFLGLILVAASPGGVTSNLMTYLGKGDVALSVSLTAVCTVLALVFTPLLLALYGSNIPDFSIPVVEVVKTMAVLVIVPLMVGMLVRAKWERGAKRAEKPFALLGVVALLFLIIVGIWSNIDKFADTDRYSLKFYAVVFALTLLGMVLAGTVAKALRVNNYQTRAISLEVGLRNASLSMTIALLLQDQMGDFSSSMFFASGIFGLAMYFAGAFSIFGFKRLLPVDESEIEGLKPGESKASSES